MHTPHLPNTGQKHPVVVLVHGGCWRARVSLDYFGQAAKALTKLGIAVLNIEYRRIGSGGGWPTTFQDVAAATDSLKVLAQEHSLDLSRVIAVGHSAGGQLVHWLAARTKLEPGQELYQPNPLELLGFVSLAGIPDLRGAVTHGICDDAAPVKLMGGLPSELPERYAQASPAELAPLSCQQVFIQGKQDDVVPHDYVEAYVAKAKEREENIGLLSLDKTGHFEIVVPSTAQWQKVEQVIKDMLEL